MKYPLIIAGAVVLAAITPFDNFIMDVGMGAAWGFLVSLVWPRPQPREQYWQ